MINIPKGKKYFLFNRKKCFFNNLKFGIVVALSIKTNAHILSNSNTTKYYEK